jgi:hypothetical protein
VGVAVVAVFVGLSTALGAAGGGRAPVGGGGPRPPPTTVESDSA